MCKFLIWGILQRLVDGPDHIHFVLHAAASSSSGNPDVHRPAALGFEANHICTFWAFWKARFFRAKPPLPSTTSKLFIRIHPDLPRPPHCPYPAPHPWPFNISGLHDSPGVADLVEAKEEAVVGPSGMPWTSESAGKTLWLGAQRHTQFLRSAAGRRDASSLQLSPVCWAMAACRGGCGGTISLLLRSGGLDGIPGKTFFPGVVHHGAAAPSRGGGGGCCR